MSKNEEKIVNRLHLSVDPLHLYAGTRIWEAVAKVFQLKRVARIRGEIKNDGFRSPNIEILLPGNGSTMVRMQENKIK